MKQARFESEAAAVWAEYRELLAALEQGRRRDPARPVERFPALFRSLCAHYALARSRGYSPGLVADLHDLVQRGYRLLYRRRLDWPRQAMDFLAAGFPAALRRHAWAFWLAALLFFGPMLAMGIACYQDDTLIHSLLDGAEVASLESMYDPANRTPGREAERQSDTDFAMFGFYVMNNVGVAFRTFAGGLIAGIGSLFFLGLNGLVIGAAGGHLTAIGHGAPFWTFVSGHAPLELTAIAVSGAAGLLLAAALLAPGRRRRLDALRANALEAVLLVTGAMVMLILAAMIEAFWSSSTAIAGESKVLFGAAGWLLVALYFSRAGRA
jgi:uncharacterized membrane protein SpoIIM required for sporulation